MATAPPTDLCHAAALLESRQLSSVALTSLCLDRIAARNDALRAFITVMADQALVDARRADAEIAGGRYRGALHGIPISIKDLVDVAGTPTTSGSAVAPRHPLHDAPVVRNLRRAGAVIVGKTNLHEFAYGTTSDESAFGAVRHPQDPSRSPGGSSGGAAVSIVEGMALGALGTDTGGSIRIPAAACGIVGLKPTYGEISCDAVVPLSTTLDHVGPLTRTVRDCAVLFLAMRDGHVAIRAAAQPQAPAWLGVPHHYFLDKLDDDVRRLFDRARALLEGAGHSVGVVDIPLAERTSDVYLHIGLPESAWYHAPLLSTQADRYSPGVRHRIELGRYVLAEDYLRAMHARDVLRRAVDKALEGLDALVLPTLPIGAPRIGDTTVNVGGTDEPVRAMMLRLTQLFDITGHPAIALPCGTGGDGLPRSLQLVGHRGGTERLLDVAAAVEAQITGGSGSVGGGVG
jgi:aspartyl-tRNA(Asn)/glutamyl-tRNA(Gln) amidotransferase subunit A